MQSTLIRMAAAELACLTAAAHAQSNVTLYGTLDSGLFYQNASAATFSTSAPNTGPISRHKDAGMYSSHWGIHGGEELGGGYQLNFRMQGVFNATSGVYGLADTPGAIAPFNQIAAIGLAGPFGSFTAGRQIVPMVYAMLETDVRAFQYFGSILTAWIGMNTAAGWTGTSTNAPIGAAYDSNALVYQSPVFGGFSAAFEYALGETAGKFQAGGRESVILKYTGTALRVAGVYYNGHNTNPAPNTVPTAMSDNRFGYLGALYTLGSLSMSASYSNGKDPSKREAVNYDGYSLGLGYQFAPAFKVKSGVYYLKDKNVSTNRSTEYAVGGEYTLSQRTILYAQIGYVNNEGRFNQTIAYGQPVPPGMSTTATMLGIRHSF